jgi:hypothetical protein
VADQGGRDLVHARVAREVARGELRKLGVVVVREAFANLAQVLLDDVRVVEQPIAGRPDVLFGVGGGREADASAREDAAGALEPGEQGRSAVTLRERAEDLGPRDGSRALGEPFGAEELASDRASEEVERRGGTAREKRTPEAGPA